MRVRRAVVVTWTGGTAKGSGVWLNGKCFVREPMGAERENGAEEKRNAGSQELLPLKSRVHVCRIPDARPVVACGRNVIYARDNHNNSKWDGEDAKEGSTESSVHREPVL